MRKILVTFILLFLAGAGTAHAFDADDIEIHGFASTGYLKTDHNNYLLLSENGSFEFNEAGLNVTTFLNDNLRAGMQVFSRDQGDVGNNDIKLDWAFLDYQWKEMLGLRVGRIKTPIGLYNETRDYDMLRTSILLPQGLYNTYYREAMMAYQGAGLYGNLPLAAGGRFGYDLYAGTMEVKSDGIMAKYMSDTELITSSARIDRIFGGRLRWYTPLQGLTLGSSLIQLEMDMEFEGALAPMTMDWSTSNMRFFYLSADYDLGNWTLAAEYHRWKFDYTVFLDMSALELPSPPPMETTTDSESYYVLLSYRLTDWFEVGTYYNVFYNDRDDRDGKTWEQDTGYSDYSAWRKDLAVSARFDITDSWLVKLEAHLMDGAAIVDYSDNPDGFKKEWMLFAIKTTFNF